MPHTFDWDNLDDIAIGLTDKFPDVDPLYRPLHRYAQMDHRASRLRRRSAKIQREQTRSHPNGLARRMARPAKIAALADQGVPAFLLSMSRNTRLASYRTG